MRGEPIVGEQKASKKKQVREQKSENTNAPQTAGTTFPLIKDIEFAVEGHQQKVVVKTTNAVEYTTATNADGGAVLSFRKARLGANLERKLDVTDFGGVIESISSYQEGDQVRIEVAVEKSARNSVGRQENGLEWVFDPKDAMSPPGPTKTQKPGLESRTLAREDEAAYAYPVERTAAYGAGSGSAGKKKKKYTGRRIDLDFKDADIHNILRLLADVGHVNIITADDVKGSVTIRMRDVPWDHALDVILQAKGLGMVWDGNLIRVAPEAVLEKEREMEIAKRIQQRALEPLETRLIPISYAKAAELSAKGNDLLSERGKLSVDERTNVIIARDTKTQLDQIEALIRNLDTQTPQVLIESRIVEATSTYSREIGIQWGGDFTSSAATGNPTGLAFPSSIAVAGGATDGLTPTAGLSTVAGGSPNPNFGVNMPAPVGTNSGGAFGITLGSITNNANLSLRLSAMEETGTLRILSSPRILTLDNRKAIIEQGTMIPFSQVSAQGVQTAFKEAKLNLTVTPHVTAEGSVLLELQVMRDEPDFNNTGARGDPTILKRQAETELLVSDGHTAVIGGIFTRSSGSSLKKVPFFADIPIIGWLFKKKSDSDRRTEMLIFITPRIVNRAESIGH
jgi:type IV pilus assembly protein PilQ